MNKPFLLIAGEQYYPERATGDWIATFATEIEARSEVTESEKFSYQSKLSPPDKKGRPIFVIRGREYDWYEIVNLQLWTL